MVVGANIKPADNHTEQMRSLILASFAGPNAQTADHAKQKEMQAAIAAGEDKYKTFDKTGWFIGPDGIPRFEIDDSQAKFNWDKLKARARPTLPKSSAADEAKESVAEWEKYLKDMQEYEKTPDAMLQDILDHKALYDAYPQLKGVKVRLGDIMPYATASASETERDLEFGPLGPRSNGLLLHEVQHLIQQIEGTARGASFFNNPDYDKSAGEAEAYNTMNRYENPKLKKDSKGINVPGSPLWRGQPATQGRYPALMRNKDEAFGKEYVIDLKRPPAEPPKKDAPAQLPAQMVTPNAPLQDMVQWLQTNVLGKK